jgi:hypothetical protein
MVKMTTDTEQVLREAIEQAQHILAEHLEPGAHDAEATIKRLIAILDNEEIIRAMGKNS